jgi:hypothetical protein
MNIWTVGIYCPWVWLVGFCETKINTSKFPFFNHSHLFKPETYQIKLKIFMFFLQHVSISIFFLQCCIRRSRFRIKFYVQILVFPYLPNIKPFWHVFVLIFLILLDEEHEKLISKFHYGFLFWHFASCGRGLRIRRFGLTYYLQLEGPSNPPK